MKVGDTTSDIREALDEEQKQYVFHSTHQNFKTVGAHFTIETMEQLPQLIEEIEQQ
ncbi:hypothetical protein [Lysinibacillus sp. LZ02]|uniref:hypothetical protein n=1 Tax=Lysinibacillus sp. LZ02 TaxID=3420668 RepID=UPI003D35D675